jgi:hypothetical protein
VGSSDAVGGLGGSLETPGGRCAAWLAEGMTTLGTALLILVLADVQST